MLKKFTFFPRPFLTNPIFSTLSFRPLQRPTLSTLPFQPSFSTNNDPPFSKELFSYFSLNNPFLRPPSPEYNEANYKTLYLNDGLSSLEEALSSRIKKSLFFSLTSFVFFWNGLYFLMTFPSILLFLQLKISIKSTQSFNALVHRILLHENGNELKIFLCKNPENQLIVKKENLKINDFLMGNDFSTGQLYMGVDGGWKKREERVFEINRFQINFDIVGDDGKEIKGVQLVYREDLCQVEDMNELLKLFGIDK